MITKEEKIKLLEQRDKLKSEIEIDEKKFTADMHAYNVQKDKSKHSETVKIFEKRLEQIENKKRELRRLNGRISSLSKPPLKRS
jgi:hypothetical protein